MRTTYPETDKNRATHLAIREKFRRLGTDIRNGLAEIQNRHRDGDFTEEEYAQSTSRYDYWTSDILYEVKEVSIYVRACFNDQAPPCSASNG